MKDVAQILSVTTHRPWPLPHQPWIMFQTWNDLLFAHWSFPPEQIRPLVPPELELDLFDGKAWLAVTPFWMSNVRLRCLPAIPGTSRFPEMNLRTYVRWPINADHIKSRPGVFFFSLDAGSLAAVLAARLSFGLPYFWSRMAVKPLNDGFRYTSRRRSDVLPAEVEVDYRPAGPVGDRKNPLEQFLTERYCLYAVRNHRVWRAEIHHAPWSLQPAEADFRRNTLTAAHNLPLHPGPLLHFSKALDVLIYPPVRIG
jgi:uncharacterized protein YqjF (DUF2071 family)